MELDRKFEIAMSCRSISLGSLVLERAYPIVHAQRINTRYGLIVLVAIVDTPTSSVKIYLPRRYGNVVSDENLEAINSESVAILLIYKWTCPRSN